MHLLARFKGPNGEIRVLEDPVTGARLYEEGRVAQSRVLPGGEADVLYICLMASLLTGSPAALLLGCGGGSLASMLCRRGSRVAVVEVNPISFQLARTFFWMPNGIECITADVRAFARRNARTFDAIGIDVGGPRFSYPNVLDQPTIARIRRTLCEEGRIAVNISLDAPDDPVPGVIADRLAAADLEVWAFTEHPGSEEINTVILGSASSEAPSALASIAGDSWSLAQLSPRLGRRRRAQACRPGARNSAVTSAGN